MTVAPRGPGRYVYVWADGVYLQARLEESAECMLVLIGARASSARIPARPGLEATSGGAGFRLLDGERNADDAGNGDIRGRRATVSQLTKIENVRAWVRGNASTAHADWTR